MSAIRIANRYAKSLLDLAIELNALEKIHGDVVVLQNTINENRPLYLLLKSPIIKEDKKKSILLEIFGGKVDELTEKFIRIIIDKRRERHLPEILKAFIGQYNQEKHITPVKISSATPLNEENKARIAQLMKDGFGKETLEITEEVDPALLGGFILKFEDKLYNASIAHKLEEMQQEFNSNQYVKRL